MTVKSGPIRDLSATDAETLSSRAEQAMNEGREAEVVATVRDGAVRLENPLLWQWTALLQRALDHHEDALESFAIAARLDPANVSIAHGRAHTALEAGVPAVELFEQARRLNPRNGEIVIGLAAAMVAAGDGKKAVALFRENLRKNPLWLQGHVQLGQTLATLGRRDEATQSIEEALASSPGSVPLWEIYLNVQLRRGAYETIRLILNRAARAGVRSPEFAIYDAIDQAEHDPRDFPPALFELAPSGLDHVLDTWRVRHLLKIGKPEASLTILDRGLKGPRSAELWAYAATVWRMVGDRKWQWLEGDSRLVQVIDLGNRIAEPERLAEVLRSLHIGRGEYLDQSVRGGSQTDGPLFSRIDPEIQRLRSIVVSAVEEFRMTLPAVEPAHPMLSPPRSQEIRFAGSWSVRLRPGGRHSNHVHPQGWISSALYVELPVPPHDGHGGWLQLGAPDERLELTVGPHRMIEPKPSQLVLFPSWMWHGTIPFEEGERLTVAFDVALPKSP